MVKFVTVLEVKLYVKSMSEVLKDFSCESLKVVLRDKKAKLLNKCKLISLVISLC